MAYKFQVGSARLSGSTVFEEAVSAASVTSVGASTAATLSASAGVSGASVSADGNASFGDLTVGTDKLLVASNGVITLGGAADTAVDIAADSFYFRDGDGSLKRDTLADYAIAIAGDGLAASGGSLAVGVDDSSIETNADALRVKALGITNAMLAADAVDGSKLADDSVDSEHIVDGSIDLAHMSANSVDSDQYVDGSIDLAHMSANSIDSDQYVDGSIDTAHLADAQITLAKMAANSVDSDQYVDGSIDTAHLGDAQVTEAKLATSVAGVGLSGGGGAALALDLNELTAEVLASGDFLAFVDSTDNGTHKETIDDLAIFMAGPGLGAQSGSLGVTTDGATLEVDSDTVRVKDAGITLAKMAVNSVDSDQYVDGSIDLVHMSANSVDSDQYVDGSIDTAHIADSQITLAKMAANSVDSDQYVDGSIDTAHLGDAQVTEAKLATSVAGDGLSGGGGSALALDLNELTAAVIDVSADSFAIIDGGDNSSKKESIADFMTAVAGTGLTAASGVLNAHLDVGLKADTETLAVGLNYMADMSADGEDTLNLPASSGLTVGDIIHVKAPSDCSSDRTVKILKNGSQTIDGLTQVIIESPFGAVSMVYVAADTFRLI